MRTISTVLREARVAKRYSRAHVAEETKIRREFIEAIEKGNWDRLPEYPVVHGFVSSIAQALNLDRKQTVALLRRDYPPKTLPINPKPDMVNKFVWSPKLTFLLGIGVVFLMIIGYLIYQYIHFITPPVLTITFPQGGQRIEKEELTVTGFSSPEATVIVNNQPALVDAQGSFSATIEIFEGTDEVIVKATSRSGKEAIIHRTIKPDLKK